jgi:N-acetyl-anhydromuramyl-L-alanine amidase AmpD
MTTRSAASIAALVLLALPAASFAKTSGTKRTKVDKLIIHAIGGPHCSDDNKSVVFNQVTGDSKKWQKYFAAHDVLGIHYIVDRAGKVAAGVPENEVANHAKGDNDRSIGIELVNNGDGKEAFSGAQVDAVIKLAKEIVARWHIPLARVVRHSDVDKGELLPCGSPRKVDPGPKFPWAKFKASLK